MVVCCGDSGDLDDDAAAPRLFAEAGLEMLVAQSYSKNLGLYGERVGALNVVLNDAQVTAAGSDVMHSLQKLMISNTAACCDSSIVLSCCCFERSRECCLLSPGAHLHGLHCD